MGDTTLIVIRCIPETLKQNVLISTLLETLICVRFK